MTRSASSSRLAEIRTCCISCGRESAEYRRKEAERAQRLASELATKVEKVSDETKKMRDQLQQSDAALTRAIPEHKTYHEQLINGSRQIDQLVEMIGAKRYGEIAAVAFDGFKKSSSLGMEFFRKGTEQLRASIKLIDEQKYSEVNQSTNKAKYYQALAGVASAQEGVFLSIYKTLLLNSPPAERLALFEQAAKACSSIERPGAGVALANALRQAYKDESSPENRTRMEHWLEQYKIPESSETPAPSVTP